MGKKPRIKLRFGFRTWLLRHAQVALYSTGRMVKHWQSTLLTALIVGIAIALPLGMHLLTSNLERLADQWEGAANISAFLHQELTVENTLTLTKKVEQISGVESVQYLSPSDALIEFRSMSGFDEALALLQENPLPPTLLIHTKLTNSQQAAVAQLIEALAKIPEIEVAEADSLWIQRFQAIATLLQRLVIILASILGVAVVLVMGNSIRLEIQGRQKEIEIIKLVGGTNGFARRPFLYEGVLIGVLGGSFGCLFAAIATWLMEAPTQSLSELYSTEFQLTFLQPTEILAVLLSCSLLGWIGAWIASWQYLQSDIGQ